MIATSLVNVEDQEKSDRQFPILMQHNGIVDGEGNPIFKGMVYLFISEYRSIIVGFPITINDLGVTLGEVVNWGKSVWDFSFLSPFKGQVILRNR